MFPADIKVTFGLVVMGAARTIPLAWSIPAFGGPSLPSQIRLAMGVGLSFLCLPVLPGQLPLAGTMLWGLLVAREVMVGVVMGFVCACMFRAAEGAGQFTDVLRGASMAEVLSPTGENRTSPFGVLMLLLAAVVFFQMGGLVHVSSALVRSYEAIPLNGPMRIIVSPRSLATVVIVASAKLIESAVGLCAPVVVALLLADIMLGIVGRVVRQIPTYSVGMPLKALLAVGVVLLGLAGLDTALHAGFRGFFELLGAALRFRQ